MTSLRRRHSMGRYNNNNNIENEKGGSGGFLVQDGECNTATAAPHEESIPIATSSNNHTTATMQRHSPASPRNSSLTTAPRSCSSFDSTSLQMPLSDQYSMNMTPSMQQLKNKANRERHLFWTRIFTRCRVFIAGILLGCIVTQSYTVGVSLCVSQQNHYHHPGNSIHGFDLPGGMRSRMKAVDDNYNHGAPEAAVVAGGGAAAAPLSPVDVANAVAHQESKPQQQQQAQPQVAQVRPLTQTDSIAAGERKLVPIELQPGNFSTIVDFEKQGGVVIATKIHGPPVMKQLKQCLCLLTAAYNDRLNYDILLFTTEPISDPDMKELKEIVHPAVLTIETDKKTLSDHIKDMTRAQRAVLKKRCEVNTTDELYWWTRCCEEGATGSCMPLAYTWQSEFRAKHLWTHPALAGYKTMMWFDSDAMSTRVWDTDPVATFLRNGLKILFANYPQGKSAGEDLREKIMLAFNNDTLCDLKLRDGHFEAKGGNCKKPFIPNIHGFFHITDLDFFRSPEILNWFNILIGDSKFSRRWDDQLAVTVPAAMRAPDLSYEMQYFGINNDVWHNQFMDGKRRWRGGGFQIFWQRNGTTSFPKAAARCTINNSG